MMSKKTMQKVFSFFLLAGMLLSLARPSMAHAMPQPILSDAFLASTSQAALAPEPDEKGLAKIEPMLLDSINTSGSSDFIVRFAEQADLSAAYEMAWKERGEFVYNTLQETAARSQARAIEYLKERSIDYQSFFTGNELFVKAGDLDAVTSMAALEEVASIHAPRTYYIDPVEVTDQALDFTWVGELVASNTMPTVIDPSNDSVNATTDWGIIDTGADDFWAAFGSQGAGIVVANIDTGVQWNHPALVDSYKCGSDPTDPACWSDPSNICGAGGACDNNGHGTHTMGTMVANDDDALPYIAGMAPDAQWIACKGCETTGCSETALNTCADWILAPNGNPDNRPNIVNNSWGGDGGDTWYLAKVNAWRAAGIFPAFSAGNSGPTCGSAGSPGDYQESFASANHQSSREIASSSSRGPSDFGHDPYTKPNISAPGSLICSTVPTNSWNCGYSGTSMASPHSAGAVALLWSCNPSLVGQIDQTFEILQDSADVPLAGNCGAPPDGEGNYTYGYGYLNVFAAGLENCAASGILVGTVTDGTNPIVGATIVATLDITHTYQTTTNASGDYSLTVVVGAYTVEASAFGYVTGSATGVVVVEGGTTVQDFNLALATSSLISVDVVDANTGWPLYAQVVFDGTPWDPMWTDPVTGHYEMLVPDGTDLTLYVDAWIPGYLQGVVDIGPVSGPETVLVELEPDLAMCNAPGYSISGGLSQNFDMATPPALPAGWAEVILNDPGTDPNWDTRAGTRYPSGYPAHSSPNLIYFNSFSVSSGGQARLYTLSGFDMTAFPAHNLSFWMFRDDGYSTNNDRIHIQVSTDSGVTWVNVGPEFSRYSALGDYWEQKSVDLSAFSTETNLMLGFLATSAYGNDIHLDDILLGVECTAPSGGLVVGNVYNENTNTPLVGALVSNDTDGTFMAAATPDDDDVDDAFYTLYSPAGTHVFAATLTGYSPDVQDVVVSAGDTVEADFYLPAPSLVIDPTSLSTSLVLGDTTTEPMTIMNDGGVALDFELRENEGEFYPSDTPLAGEDVLVVRYDTTAATAMETALTVNGYTYLGVTGTAFLSTPVADLLTYKAVFFAGNATSSYHPLLMAYLDAGGSLYISDNDLGYSNNSTVFYQTYLQATYGIDNGGDLLTGDDIMAGLNPDITDDPYPDTFTIGPYGAQIFHFTVSGASAGVKVTRNDYLAIYTSFDFDDIASVADEIDLINRVMAYIGVSDVTWLSESPITGTVPAAGTQPVLVTFDATVPEVDQPGTYIADLVAKSNDPANPRVTVPVEMVVTAPANWGKLAGTVTGLGYCDANPGALEAVEVIVEASTGITWTLETDANGYYQVWMDEANSPVMINVTADGHTPGYASGIIIVGGQTTTMDFSLRWLKPCVSASPDTLEATVTLGVSTTVTLTLQNAGALVTDFNLNEKEGGYSPTLKGTETRTTPQQVDQEKIIRLPDGSVDCAAYKDSIYAEPAEVGAACGDGLSDPVKVGSPTAPTDIGYAQDIGYVSDNFVSFTLNDFSGQAVVGTSTNAYYGMDFDPEAEVLYAINDATGQLGTIDLATGAFTGLVPCPAPVDIWTGLTISSDGTFYASDATDLYVIDPATGNYTLIGPFGVSLMIDIAINSEGVMYGHDIETDSIYQIDLTTGTATLIGLTGYSANYAQGMDFDFEDGTLYIFLYQGSGANVYGTVNLTTGAVTPLSVSNPQGEFEGAVKVAGVQDVPWLSEDPVAGTLDPDTGEVIVDVTMDSSVVPQPGKYFATLKVKTDDPMHGTINVPVTMTVSATSDYGLLKGTVQGLGYCDADPAPIEGAEVMIEASDDTIYTVMTDENGYYSYWLLVEGNNYTVSVTAEGHEPGVQPDVVIVGQGETQVDFDLRWLEPCISTVPPALEVDVPLGYDKTVVLDILNGGAVSTDFEMGEVPPPTILSLTGVSRPVVTSSTPKVVTIGDKMLSTNPHPPVMSQVLIKLRPASVNATTITHSASQDILSGNSVACTYTATGYHTNNSYLRVFDLPAFGIDTDFNITNVEIGIETADGGTGLQPATVNLYTLDGAFIWANLTLIGTADVVVVDGDLNIINMDVTGTAPAGSQLVVEFFTPDGATAGNSLFVGSNDLGQTGPTYLAAADCSISEPTDVGSIGFPEMMLVMNVTGEVGSSDVPWLAEDPITGTLDSDSSFPVDVTFTTFPLTMTVGDVYTASLIVNSDDPVNPKVVVPVRMNVIEPVYGVEVSADQVGLGEPGDVVSYTVTVINLSNFSTDSFNVTLGTHTFETVVDPVIVGPLAMGGSATFEVTVTIPEDAQNGGHDTVQITVTSVGDTTKFDMVSVTTNVYKTFYIINLPLLWRAPAP